MVAVIFASIPKTLGVHVLNKRAVELAGAGVFLSGVSLQIGEMIFELRRACARHSFDRRFYNNATMETPLDRLA